ncbi:MAG: four helix bundle suffix domain-containing protein [Muribaculaceae bacterium]|nr:four helix bundle suffix domain-containing protein [Muribaculaceae bacterium]
MAGFILHTGDFSNWNVYRKAVVICDVTEMFVRRAFVSPNRTIDQMRQAARSCKQNIVEGVSDGATSSKTCLKLLGIAKGSARELLEDYKDYLRQNGHEIWKEDDSKLASTREYCRTHDNPQDFVAKCEQRSNATVANIMVTQLHQMDFLLRVVIKKVEEDFLANGGISERMMAERKKKRGY